jgi:ribosomal protein S18 acetylase RimI-like enzyme
MKVIRLQEKDRINNYLQKNKPLHIYSIGDLDDFFWDNTTWYGLEDNSELQSVILLYNGLSVPTMLALSEDIEPVKELMEEIIPILPSRMYTHFSPGLINILERTHNTASYGDHYKMFLKNLKDIKVSDHSQVERLETDDLIEINQFYKESYPGNWFDDRMLESGHYYGLRLDGRLVSTAGIHVYSSKYKVAALGNIATNPDFRGRGFGKLVTIRCCQSLFETVDMIGLNVKVDNNAAIAIYHKLGFEIAGVYGEYMAERK